MNRYMGGHEFVSQFEGCNRLGNVFRISNSTRYDLNDQLVDTSINSDTSVGQTASTFISQSYTFPTDFTVTNSAPSYAVTPTGNNSFFPHWGTGAMPLISMNCDARGNINTGSSLFSRVILDIDTFNRDLQNIEVELYRTPRIFSSANSRIIINGSISTLTTAAFDAMQDDIDDDIKNYLKTSSTGSIQDAQNEVEVDYSFAVTPTWITGHFVEYYLVSESDLYTILSYDNSSDFTKANFESLGMTNLRDAIDSGGGQYWGIVKISQCPYSSISFSLSATSTVLVDSTSDTAQYVDELFLGSDLSFLGVNPIGGDKVIVGSNAFQNTAVDDGVTVYDSGTNVLATGRYKGFIGTSRSESFETLTGDFLDPDAYRIESDTSSDQYNISKDFNNSTNRDIPKVFHTSFKTIDLSP